MVAGSEPLISPDGQRLTFRLAPVTLAQVEGPLGTTGSIALPRAWYWASLAEFLRAEQGGILGRLAANSGFADVPEQKPLRYSHYT